MAVVGDAQIIVRAITTSIPGDLRRGFNGADRIAQNAGSRFGSTFSNALRRNMNTGNAFTQLSAKMKEVLGRADGLREAFVSADRTARFLSTAISGLVGAISSVIGGIVALGANVLGAASSFAVLGNAVFAGIGAMATFKLALGGVGRALGALNKAQAGGAASSGASAAAARAAADARAAAARRVEDAERALAKVIDDNKKDLLAANNEVRRSQIALNQALKAGREEIQQLGFDAEDAALGEKSAALELQKARDELAGVQDLPPNSRARQEAQLAYDQADLAYRQAKDRAADTAAEQDRLAKEGIAGTQAYQSANEDLRKSEEDRAKTVIDGAEKQADAERDVLRAKEEQAKANRKAQDAAAGGGGGGADPFAGLNAAQIKFVKFLQTLKPMYDQLKLTASNALLPPLEDAIRIFAYGLFPTVNKGIGEIGRALGGAAIGFATIATNARNLSNLGTLFTSSATFLSYFGTIIGNYFSAILTILKGAAPLAERFAKFLAIASGNLSQALDNADKSGALKEFFGRAGDAAAQLGNIFGNVFKGLGNIINANLGPGTGGGLLLDWVQQASKNFLNLTRDTGPLKDFFVDVALNFKAIGSSVGALVKELVILGANPAIGETFDVLKTGAPLLGDILNNTAAAGPALARLVVALLRIVRVFADTKSLDVFFGILGAIAEKIADIVETPAVTNFLNFIGPIFAGLSAIFLAGSLAINGLLIGLSFLAAPIVAITGIVGTLGTVFGTISGIIATVSQAFAFMTYSANPFVALLGRLPALLGPIGLFIGIFTLLYTTSDDFRNAINGLAKVLFQSLMTAFKQIMAAVQPLIGVITGQLIPAFSSILTALTPLLSALIVGLVGVVVQLITTLLPTFVQIISTVAQVLTTVLSAVIPVVVMLVEQLAPILTQIIGIFFKLVAQIIDAVIPVFLAIIDAVLPLVTTLINTLVPAIMSIITAIIPLITTILNALIPVFNFLIPIIVFLAGIIAQALVFGVQMLINVLNFLMPVITLVINFLAVLLVGAINVLVGVFQGIIGVVGTVANFLITSWQNIWKVLGGIIDAIVGFIRRQFNSIVQFFRDWDFEKLWNSTWRNVRKFFEDIWQTIQDNFRDSGNALLGLVEGIMNGVIDIVNGAIKAWDALWDKVRDATGGSINFHIDPLAHVSIPRMATGGTVMPSSGGSLVNVAEAGRPERIEPLDSQGLSQRDRALIAELAPSNPGNVQIVLNPPPGSNNAEIATMVNREIAFQMRRGATK